MFIDSVASNVESTLAFTLSVKIVELIANMQSSAAKGSGFAVLMFNGSSSSASAVTAGKYDTIIMLCTGILLFVSLSGISSPSSASAKKHRASKKSHHAAVAPSGLLPAAVRKDMKDIASHVLLLAFSRMAMQQIRLKTLMLDPSASVESTVFNYAQRILEIMFVVTILSCVLTIVFPMMMMLPSSSAAGKTNGGSSSSVFSGALANRQLNSLMVNMQRTFAETVASFVNDAQTRKMIVLLGLCMLPSISSVVSGGAQQKVVDIRSIESFFLASMSQSSSARKRRGRKEGTDQAGEAGGGRSHVYANFLVKLWTAGLSMAWMNTTLGFILPSSGGASSALGMWMRVVSTICLAVLSRSLQPMFPGLNMFQSYIEWSIATSTLNSIRLSSKKQMTTLFTVFCTGLAFYVVDAFYRDVARAELLDQQKGVRMSAMQKDAKHADQDASAAASAAFVQQSSRVSNTLQTLQSVTIIMFTNSLVSWSMEVISGSSSAAGDVGGGLGQAFATIVAGIVVSRVVVQVVDAEKRKQQMVSQL